MPKTVSAVMPSGAFPDATLTVPLGADSRSNAAEVVEAIAQGVINRLEYLRQRAVLSDAGGSINDGQQLQLTPGAISRDSNVAPIEFVPQVFTDAFYLLMTAQMGASEVQLYAAPSPNSTLEQFAIVVNARWNHATTMWHQTAGAFESFAVLIRAEESPGPVNSRIIVGKRPAGTGTDWTTWTRADLEAGKAILNSGEIDHPSGEWTYKAARTTTTVMGCGTPRAGGHDGGNGNLMTDGSLSHSFIDLRFPPNWDTSSASIEVLHYQATSAPAALAVVERVLNFTTPGVTQNVLVTTSGPASSGDKKTTVSLASITFDQATKEYRLRWIPGDAGDQFLGWRIVGWKDGGPRNTLS